jgi:GNAT superfamily N-acetyltransferase
MPVPAAQLPGSPITRLHTVELTHGSEPLLQRFFDANPAYFLTTQGEPAGPNQAHEEIHEVLPAGWSFSRKWVMGYVDEGGSLAAMANVVEDLLASGVWHIGTFIVATSRHGTGDAQALYRGLEQWASANGANWLRLGVVTGNTRAERFWLSEGYVGTRTREGLPFGRQTRTVRIMVKPLAGGTLAEYLSIVPRDRPEAP